MAEAKRKYEEEIAGIAAESTGTATLADGAKRHCSGKGGDANSNLAEALAVAERTAGNLDKELQKTKTPKMSR